MLLFLVSGVNPALNLWRQWRFVSSYHAIQVGDSKQAAIAGLGEPSSQSDWHAGESHLRWNYIPGEKLRSDVYVIFDRNDRVRVVSSRSFWYEFVDPLGNRHRW